MSPTEAKIVGTGQAARGELRQQDMCISFSETVLSARKVLEEESLDLSLNHGHE